MVSTSEVGHAKNVANFHNLISFVTGYGTVYNPTKTSLQLTQLGTTYTAAQNYLADVIAKSTAYNGKVNNRQTAFESLKPLATRVLSALDATDATQKTIADAKGFVRKLRGKRASAKTINPDSPAPNTISTSQQSYDQQIQHFTGLILIAKSEPSYSPNENELKIASLLEKLNDLTAKNKEVSIAFIGLSNSRISRNTGLYGTDTGLVDIASDVKKYVKSLFGATSPQYAQVKAIPFRIIKT